MTATHLAEYGEADALLATIPALSARGHRVVEAYTPYPVEGLDEALGRGPSRLPWLVFAVALGAALAAYALQWLLNAYLYPLNVGHRPPHYPLSFVPITFEMGILFGAFTAVFGVLLAARLMRLWDPVFEVEGFDSATNDAFWLALRTREGGTRPAAEATTSVEDELRASGARRVLRVPQEEA